MKYYMSMCVACLLTTLSAAVPTTTNHVTDTSNTTTSAVTNTSTVSTPTIHHIGEDDANDGSDLYKVVCAIFLIVATFIVIAVVIIMMVKRSMCDWCCVYCPCCNDDEDDEENERLDAMLEHFPTTDSNDLVKMYAGTGAC